MISPGSYDIMVMRWQPNKVVLDVIGYDLAGASSYLQVRSYRDQSGLPLLSLSLGDGIVITSTVEGGVTTSTVVITFSEDAIEALPFAVPRGTDVLLVYDLVISGAGLGKVRWLEGKFIVHAGATQA